MHVNISALLTQSCMNEKIAQANGTLVAPGYSGFMTPELWFYDGGYLRLNRASMSMCVSNETGNTVVGSKEHHLWPI